MIREIRVRNFKAFTTFAVNFQQFSLLVGPNSAGKSTILAALRLAESCMRLAKRSKPTLTCMHLSTGRVAYPVPIRDFEALNESVRHNFRDSETSIELEWKNGCKLRIVWPEVSPYDDFESPFFYLLDENGRTPRSLAHVRAIFSIIGVIPALSPLEHEEPLLANDYVRQNQSGRLSSRHFRNQLRLLMEADEWRDFVAFCDPWIAGMKIKRPVIRYNPANIDVFYTEDGSGVEKELVWAGDGVQIWLQLLLHLYRSRDLPTLVLDEPEVFLHADLQRRLVRLLEALGKQVVLATHSTEVLAEVSRNSIVWVDKSRRRAVRSPKDESLRGLDSALGTSFNLAMAKALRARGVLFVEGRDIKLLRKLAGVLSLQEIIEETCLAVIPMNGYSRWENAEAFGWLLKEFLGDSVSAMVILDRDYRTDAQVASVEEKLSGSGMSAHIWKKKEIESYLLIPSVISRLTKCPAGEIESIIDAAMLKMENMATARFIAERHASEKAANRNAVTITEEALGELGLKWRDRDFRYASCPPKDILAELNKGLQSAGYKAVSFSAISKSVRADELDGEMIEILTSIDALAGK